MCCPLCGNHGARKDLSFGGGSRFYCEPCGGFFRISSTLDALAEGRIYDTKRARDRLEEQRKAHDQDPEPALGPDDADLLTDPD
jgi:transposase-like protein